MRTCTGLIPCQHKALACGCVCSASKQSDCATNVDTVVPQQPRRRVPPSTTSARTIARMSMSTRMKGAGLRFQLSKTGEEGEFVEGLPVNQDIEMDGLNRNMCDKCATCDEYLGRVRAVCRTCAKSLHDVCVVEHEQRHRRS